MRLWSIHPSYLDKQGLTGLWRETLLARKVLSGQTRGYRNHPQLIRFKATINPINTINSYLSEIYKESLARGYKFDKSKLAKYKMTKPIPVTYGQLIYETRHLKRKLKIRDIHRYNKIIKLKILKLHPLFYKIPGKIEIWEKPLP